MPHKITLTGIPVSSLRENDKNVYSFDMEEKGSPNAPKGLPISNTITYTVFVSKKSIEKANIDVNNFENTKLLVQGEPTLDLPIDECPGEIGVICFQLSVLEQKHKDKKPDKENSEDITKENIVVYNIPDFSMCDYIYLDRILVPDNIDEPNPKKLDRAMNFIKETGNLEMAIEVNYVKGKLYVNNNRYVHFLAAKEAGIEKVPVNLIVSKKYTPMNTDKYLLLDNIKVPDEFLSSNPNPSKIESVNKHFKKYGIIDKPITVAKDSLLLVDGYIRYVYLKQNDILFAPVKWV